MQQADSQYGELRQMLVRMEARLTGIELKIAGVHIYPVADSVVR